MNRWLLVLILVVACVCSAPWVQAQPIDVVTVDASRPNLHLSRYLHWNNAEYLWTVSGYGIIAENPLRIEADARFSLTDISGVPKPKLPLSDNPELVLKTLCTFSSVSCRSYLATNAEVATGKVLVDMLGRSIDSEEMKAFRFVPDIDIYSPVHEYTAVVQGRDVAGQFIFIDRYGESGNVFYNDNFTGGSPTAFSVRIERKSPELILAEGKNIINDDELPNVLRSRTLSLGTLSLGAVASGAALSSVQVVRNRGIDDLAIESIVVTGDVPDFEVRRRDGVPLATRTILKRSPLTNDSMAIEFRFVPKSIGNKEIQVRVYCNDTTQNADGGKRYFFFVVRGTGTDARLSVVDTVDFGDVRVGSAAADTTIMVKSIGLSPADFSYSTPSLPFGITDARDNGKMPSAVTGLAQGKVDSVRLVFNPTTFGNFVDSVIVGEGNTQRYVVYLKGRGLTSAVILFADTLKPALDTIDFGVTQAGIPVSRPFFVRNVGNIPLKILAQVKPHYIVENTGNSRPNDRLEFDPSFSFSALIDTTAGNKLTTLMMRFRADNNIPVFPTGNIEAFLTIGVSEPAKTQTGQDTFRIVESRRFVLVARKVEARPKVNNREDFDSVYVRSNCADGKVAWPVTNISKDTVRLEGDRIEFIHTSNGNPFSLTGRTYPVVLQPNETDERAITYRPTTRGPDTARFWLFYSPPLRDSVDVLVSGVGVEQELRLDSALKNFPSDRYTINSDTIDLGDVRVCSSQPVTVFLSNKGNLPFRLRSEGQKIDPLRFPGTRSDFFQLPMPFRSTTINIGDTARLILTVSPYESGEHVLRYTLPSDITTPERGIKCVPEAASAKVFFIRFRAIHPRLHVDKPKLDFENVLYIDGCIRSKELALRVTNTGNSLLDVQRSIVQNGTEFIALPTSSMAIAPGTSAVLTVRFTPTSIGVFRDTLLLVHTAGCPTDTTRVIIVGTAVPPQPITVSLPPLIQSRPGRRIAVPITVDNAEYLSSVRKFSTTLLYDQSLLVYAGSYITEATASEQASISDIKIEENPRGKLAIDIAQPEGITFYPRNTLIVLLFDTYLGTVAYTPISFRSTEFSDDGCAGLLTISTDRGVVALDSVCNLESLIGPPATGAFRLEQNAPNPAEEESFIEFEVAFPTVVRLALYNNRGELITLMADGWHLPGQYRMRVPSELLPQGLYFYEMRAGIFQQVRKMYIAK